jgi:type VI protein secretion system component VasK
MPDMTTVKDFEQILESFIRETESGTNKYPLDLSN